MRLTREEIVSRRARFAPTSSAANWVIAAALAVIAIALVVRRDPLAIDPAFAQAPGQPRGLQAFTGQIDKNTYGLFMIDSDVGTVWVYEYNPVRKKLRLAAARSFLYDRYLADWNNDEGTSPDKIERMVEQQRKRRLQDGAAPPPAMTTTDDLIDDPYAPATSDGVGDVDRVEPTSPGPQGSP